MNCYSSPTGSVISLVPFVVPLVVLCKTPLYLKLLLKIYFVLAQLAVVKMISLNYLYHIITRIFKVLKNPIKSEVSAHKYSAD